MSNTPFISVMVLSYNYGHLLKRALDAIARQSFRDFELLFINNGAIDNSQDVYEAFAAEHPELNTRCVRITENQGATNGWNHGLEQAQGEYVMFHDADDWMEDTCLEELAKAAKETGAEQVTAQYQEIASGGEKGRIRHLFPSANNPIGTPMLQGSIFRKSVIDKAQISLPIGLMPYDYYFTYMFAAHASSKPVLLKKTLYNYYFNPDSVFNGICKIQENHYLRYNLIDKPLLDLTSECMQHTNDTSLRDRMSYFTIRSTYASILYYYAVLPHNVAEELYERLQCDMKQTLGNYRKNRFLFPIGNKCELVSGVAVWGLVLAEKMGCSKKASRLFSKIYTKKSTELGR